MSAARIIVVPPTYRELRLTIPAREALARAGNRVEPSGSATAEPATYDPARPPSLQRLGVATYAVTLTRPPAGIVACLIGSGADQHRGLRLAEEPAYPGEWPEGTVAWHERGQYVPCPTCGGALVWYEAGYVPGYRICVIGRHHAQLSEDGRSAKRIRRAS